MFESNDAPEPQRASLSDLLARAGLRGVPRSALIGVVVVVGLTLAYVGWRLGGAALDGEFAYRDGDPAGVIANPSQPGGAAAGSEQQAVSTSIWVHVAGAVSAPGLYELPATARVGDALEAAGGPLPDASVDAVNLARQLGDGEQVYLPRVDEMDAPGATASPSSAAGTVPGEASVVDINRANATELESLPGIGPSTAEKIVADRDANGPFTSPEDLMRVTGIGEKKFEALRDMVVVR